MGSDQRGRRFLILLALILEAGLGVLAWGLGCLLGQPPLVSLRWEVHALLLGVPATLPLLAIFYLCLRCPVGPFARIKQFFDQVIRPFFAPCSLLTLALLSLAAGVGEEMLFRGVLQAAFGRWLGLWLGLAAASALFGLLHMITPTYAVLATVMGAYLGWLWLTTENLLVVIVTHALYDWIALLYLVRGPLPAPTTSTSTE
jgi:membrane protease YdiL (CAAX protease family)